LTLAGPQITHDTAMSMLLLGYLGFCS